MTKLTVGMIGVPTDVHFKRRLSKIDRTQFQVTIISPSYFKETFCEGFEVFSVNFNQFTTLRWFQFFYQYFLFMKKKDFDIIYCFGALPSMCWLAGIVARKCLVVTTIGSDVFPDEQLKTTWLVKKNIEWLLRSADRVTTLSLAMEKRLRIYFKIQEKRIERDFLDIEDAWYSKIAEHSRTEYFQKYSPIILSPRMLDSLYQQAEIIKSLALVKKKFPNVLLIQTGFCMNKEYFQECQSLIKDKELENNVLFLEKFNEASELISFFDLADMVIMIPKSDGMPSSLIEAWARKKPTIVSNIYNYEDCFERKLYLKTDVNPEAIANGICEMMDNQGLRKRITEEGTNFLIAQRNKMKELVVFKGLKVNNKKSFFSKVLRFVLFIAFILEPLVNCSKSRAN
jgi:glycosyltransferase involved in cell wall biosynthesis